MNQDAMKVVRRFYLIMKRVKQRRIHLADTMAQLHLLYEDVENLFHISELFDDVYTKPEDPTEGPVGE